MKHHSPKHDTGGAMARHNRPVAPACPPQPQDPARVPTFESPPTSRLPKANDQNWPELRQFTNTYKQYAIIGCKEVQQKNAHLSSFNMQFFA
jgi:hypothetical protein